VLNVIDFNKLIRRHHNQVFTLDKETKAQNGIKGPGTCPGVWRLDDFNLYWDRFN